LDISKNLFVLYKDLMAKHVNSVNLLTLPFEKGLISCTISSLVSVSVSETEPPVIGFSLKEKSELEQKLNIGDTAFVSLLSDDQIDIALHFAKFRVGANEELQVRDDSLDFKEIIGYFKIKATHKMSLGTSKFFFCEVIDVEIITASLKPLSYYQRKFNGLNCF
jgi:flavin reductase (DIM6/NTAB) family NADH-FMN oxidoreductase RutF